MIIKPSDKEKQELETFDEHQRLHYFLTRTLESEEIWGLGDDSGWVMEESTDCVSLPVWPYACFAEECTHDKWNYCSPLSMSLEHFLYKILPKMDQQQIMVDVFPKKDSTGLRIPAAKFSEMIEGMLESGEYYMEG